MIYNLYKPSFYLNHIVEHYWYSKIKLNDAIMRHHPASLMQGLAFNFNKYEEHHTYNGKTLQLNRQAYLFGQSTYSHLVKNESMVDILGVKFKPLGIAKVTGINMENLADCIIPAESIWGRELNLLCDEMQSASNLQVTILVLEKFLLRKSNQVKLHHRVNNVENALALIENSNGAINARSLQYETNTSRKTLERAFINYLGITPKLYSEITRFNQVKHCLDQDDLQQNLSGLAYDLGYSDGSHLSAEFKRFSNISPGEYLKRRGSTKILIF